MGLLDKLRDRLGGRPSQDDTPGGGGGPASAGPQDVGAPSRGSGAQDPDEAAVERYRYMLRTAPPETIEQAHAEAFAQLTPEQRRRVLDDVGQNVPAGERASSDDPQAMARMATRAEMRRPGTMERSLGGPGGGMGGRGMGMGGMIAGTLLASVAGAFIGTAIADAFLDDNPMPEEDLAAGDEAAQEPAADDPGADPGFEDPGSFGGMDDFGGMDEF